VSKLLESDVGSVISTSYAGSRKVVAIQIRVAIDTGNRNLLKKYVVKSLITRDSKYRAA
jgi:hypothetical protein